MINVAGAFSHFSDLFILLTKYRFRDICVYDGLDNHPWNGGRVNHLYSAGFNHDIVRQWNSRGIGVFLTLSNKYIDFVLEPREALSALGENNLNGVIVANHDLACMIRKKYPNLRLMLSVTYFTNIDVPNNMGELESMYDFICPRYEWVFNPNFYKKISTKKYEIMLNDTCKYGCPLWGQHFDAINQANRDGIANCDELHKIQECWLTNGNPRDGWQCDIDRYGDDLGMDLTPRQIKAAQKIGYKHWKISGREFSRSEYVGEISEFLQNLRVADVL